MRHTSCEASGFSVGVSEFSTTAARIDAQEAAISSYQRAGAQGLNCEFLVVVRGRLLAYNSDPNVPEIGVTYDKTASGMRRIAQVLQVEPIVVPTDCGS